MIKVSLRRNDGLPSGRIWLRSVVRTIQRALAKAGYAIGVDGRFGSDTSSVLKTFQQDHGLDATGIVGQQEWNGLVDFVDQEPVHDLEKWLPTFHGDIDWIHDLEGHRGRPYWPGGNSGVTLDPGVDLGHASSDLIEELYAPLTTAEQMAALLMVFGIKGEHARTALGRVPEILEIRVSREQAIELMPYAASSYWRGITSRFPAIGRAATPAAVQTALLSLAYNRGPFNPYLESLSEPIAEGEWASAARKIGSMQQKHRLEGIRKRRRYEGALIEVELEFSGLA